MKKTITIEVDANLIKDIKNAATAYGSICYSLILGTSVPKEFEALKALSDDEVTYRFNALKEFCMEIERQFEEAK